MVSHSWKLVLVWALLFQINLSTAIQSLEWATFRFERMVWKVLDLAFVERSKLLR
jgi:hypothetical protein